MKLLHQKRTPLSIQNVTIDDEFWSPKLKTFRDVMLNDVFTKWEKERGRAFDNFDRVARGETGTHYGYWFFDGQIWETMRGAADFLAQNYDEALDRRLDGYIERIAAAQAVDPDGYLHTWVTLQAPNQRWGANGGNRALQHEIYNAGCLVEAAVHHYRATGKINLLKVAVKFADYMCAYIGPPPKHPLITDHPLSEEAFIKLYQLFRDFPALQHQFEPRVEAEKYLELARFWIDYRGRTPKEDCFSEYQFADPPLTESSEIVGHAVIAGLLCAGLTALGRESGAPVHLNTARRLWESAIHRKIYLTGGAGNGKGGEGFGAEYDLPNDGYLETCAAVAMAFWHQNMFLAFGDGKYVDELERVLYNGALVGVSLEGNRYFYANPLVCKNHDRWDWHECPCCPPMFLKLFGEMPSYIYAQSDDSIFINLFVGSTVRFDGNNQPLIIHQETAYPWSGQVQLTLEMQRTQEFSMNIRIPGWARGVAIDGGLYAFCDDGIEDISLRINNKTVKYKVENGYVHLKRNWHGGDRIELHLPMSTRYVKSHPNLLDNAGKLALQRGPLIYCFENVDNPTGIHHFFLNDNTKPTFEFEKSLLDGVGVLKGKGSQKTVNSKENTAVMFTAIPYYAWNNRGSGEMAVWLPNGNIPEFMPTSTAFYPDQIVEIYGSSETDIRFTVAGSEPTAKSKKYINGIKIRETTTIKAIGFYPDGSSSPVISANYYKTEPRKPENPRGLRTGLQVKKYAARWENLQKINTLLPVEQAVASNISYIDISLGINFIVEFNGFIDIPAAGRYTFELFTPAVAKLFISEQEVIDKPASNGPRRSMGRIVLGKGKHALKLLCYLRGNEYQRDLDVTYQGPGVEKQPIPDTVLFISTLK